MRSEKKTKADSGTRERDVVGGEERPLCRLQGGQEEGTVATGWEMENRTRREDEKENRDGLG